LHEFRLRDITDDAQRFVALRRIGALEVVRDVGLDLEDRNRCTLGAKAIGHTAP
jgi:hypothetical protein